MKRFVLAAAMMGAAVSAQAQAPTAATSGDAEFKPSGEFRLRYTGLLNETLAKDAGDNQSYLNHRFKLNTTIRKGETLQAFISLLHAGTWGYSDEASGTGANGIPGTADTNEADNVLLVNRAWGWWKATDMLSFKFGRVGLEIADGAVFSENDWEQIPVSHDGLIGMWDMDFAKLMFFGIKTDEADDLATSLAADPERNLYGVSLDFKNMPEAIKMANFHIIQEVQDEFAGGPARNAQRFGLTVGGDTAGVMYKGTVAYVTGKDKFRVGVADTDQDISSMMYDLMVGYSMPEMMGLKVSAGYHWDSGDGDADDKNEQYDPLYYDRHNYAGLMDVVRWGNLNYWNLNASLLLADDIEVGTGFYMFSRTEGNGANNMGQSYAGALATVPTDGSETDKDIGSEFDLFANKAYENGLKIGARYGMFMPGDVFEGGGRDSETAHEFFLQGSMSF